jgi:hypothetical protein
MNRLHFYYIFNKTFDIMRARYNPHGISLKGSQINAGGGTTGHDKNPFDIPVLVRDELDPVRQTPLDRRYRM